MQFENWKCPIFVFIELDVTSSLADGAALVHGLYLKR